MPRRSVGAAALIAGVGIVVLRPCRDDGFEVLLVRRATEPYLDEWFTVDGRPEPGETPRATALRELAEETSLAPRIMIRDAATPARVETVRAGVWLHGFIAFVAPGSTPALNAEHTDYGWYATEPARRLVPLASQRASILRARKRIEARSPDGLLEATRAQQIEHPGGNLRDHLEPTAALLAGFGGRPTLCTAGMLHAAYGTDGLAQTLLSLDDRPLLRALVGEEVERLVYLYCACDRARFYGSLLDGEVGYRDRFVDTDRSLTLRETRDLVELTFANELDLARQDERLRKQCAIDFGPLFRSSRGWVSEGAYDCFLRTFETARRPAR